MIKVNELSVHFDDFPVLKNINFMIDKGEFVLISGPSGCGKSTLAYTMGGVIPHSIHANITGKIEINGFNTQDHKFREIVQHVGMVFQNPSSQLFHLRVEDEVRFGPANLGLSQAEIDQRTEWAINAVGLSELRDQKPAELSGGQKQCVAIASVLAMRPKILILDEPTASLDQPNIQKILETLKRLQKDFGVTVVMIEHRITGITKLASRVILMNEGEIIADGSPESIFSNEKVRNQYGLRRNAEQSFTPWELLIEQVNPNLDKPDAIEDRAALLSLESVSVGYNKKNVLKNLNLTIYPGDFIAVVGNNGVGKSTLGLVAAGLLKPQHGKVRFITGKRPCPGVDVSMLFQNVTDQLFTDSVNEEVSFGPKNFASFDLNKHKNIMESADLTHLRERRPLSLSVGQQQRTVLSACLGLEPKVLILDEPTLGQDWGHLQRLMDYLVMLNQQGTAILLISHDYKLVHRYAKKVYLMKNNCIHRVGKVSNSNSVFERRIV